MKGTLASCGFRLVVTRARSDDSPHEHPEIQLAELDLFDQHGESILLPGSRAANPGGGIVNPQQVAARAIDRKVDTKWVDGNFKANDHYSTLELTLPSALTLSTYQLWTANDVVHRDPVSWMLQIRMADGEWLTVDERRLVEPPLERHAPYASAGFPVHVPLDSTAATSTLTGWTSCGEAHSAASPHTPTSSPSVTSLSLSNSIPIVSSAPGNGIGPNPTNAPVPQPAGAPLLQQGALINNSREASNDGRAAVGSVVMAAVLLAGLLNVYYFWGKSIRRSVRTALGNELYAACRNRLRVIRPLLKQHLCHCFSSLCKMLEGLASSARNGAGEWTQAYFWSQPQRQAEFTRVQAHHSVATEDDNAGSMRMAGGVEEGEHIEADENEDASEDLGVAGRG